MSAVCTPAPTDDVQYPPSVLRADGTVIGGLYAAGEASNGALYDLVYMSGSSFLNALSMGRIAGENAANQQ